MSCGKPLIVVWFRQDLRLTDNPALQAALETEYEILPLYILDDKNSGEWKMGRASRWWLHNSLIKLNTSLDGNLCLQKGDALEYLQEFIKRNNVHSIYWNRCYEPWRVQRDTIIKSTLTSLGITVKTFNGSLLFEPHKILKNDGTPYKVFTAFYKNGCLAKNLEPRLPNKTPIKNLNFRKTNSLCINDLGLMPKITWYRQMEQEWTPGEEGAFQKLQDFIENGLSNYKEGRNYPALSNVSRLSPHIHFGEISLNTIWHTVKAAMIEKGCEKDGEHFLSELGWREFSYNLLYYFPKMPDKNMNVKFDTFPWHQNEYVLKCWQEGKTGYPIIDAGMRELWQTGYMHNRVRMIAGSFLVKNLLLHWKHGEKWFWDTLVDADLANNSASWQWIAGCGTDTVPYFRIFNPVTQGKKFDNNGTYIRQYIPEISKLPDEFIHTPWEAPDYVLQSAGIELGTVYPWPIIDLKLSREKALAAFRTI